MKAFSILPFMTVLLLSGCRNTQVSGDGHPVLSSVTLNNGEKWPANPETTEGIRHMISLVDEFTGTPIASDCLSLKNNLDKEFNTIIKRCTMTGEAHNQLHHYLIPLAESIKKIDSGGLQGCQNSVAWLKEYLEAYKEYFI